MEIFQKAVVLSAAAILTAAPAVNAQVTEDGMGKMVPVELYACTFNDGQGMSDLDKVVARWNEFMDDNDVDTYAAWTLTPVFYGTEQDFDFIWMGAWADGNAMGTGSDMWMNDGGDVAGGFNKVADCNAHILLASAQYKAPPGNDTPGSSILRMTNCEMKVGVRYSDVMSAEIEWADYMNENGSAAGTWHWFPQLGGGDSGFDYKIVNSYPNFAALGKDWEHNANGGGREESQGLFSDLDDCDDARVYVGKSRRSAQLR